MRWSLLLSVALCNISLANQVGDTLKKESALVWNRTIGKIDENYFTLRKEWSKCVERGNKKAVEDCQENVDKKIKESLKKDLRATIPLAVGTAAVALVAAVSSDKVGRSVGNAYGTLAGLPIFVINADAGLKIGHLIVAHVFKE